MNTVPATANRRELPKPMIYRERDLKTVTNTSRKFREDAMRPVRFQSPCHWGQRRADGSSARLRLGWSSAERLAMPPDEHDARPSYSGPFAIVRPDGPFYTASIEPRMSCGSGAPLTFHQKNEAWGQMLAWAQQFALPARDETNPKMGRARIK